MSGGDGYRQLLLLWDRARQGHKRPESFNAIAHIEGALLAPCVQGISFDTRCRSIESARSGAARWEDS